MFVLAALVALAPAPLAPAVPATPSVAQQQQLPAATIARIDSIFSRFDRTDAPGCAVGVMREGRLLYSRGYGMADLQHDVPITPSSIFHVASVSKQFTVMSVLLLAAEGRLSLDDEVRRHVPEVPDFGTSITLRHLVHHTSGLRDQWTLLNLGGWRSDDPKSQADILSLVSRQKALNFPPGSEHLYSNTGYTLLAVTVERVSGKSFREFTDERIFRPLGMMSTHFHDDHNMIVKGRTSAYVPTGGGFRISIPVFDNVGATSLFTTVEDMARWEQNFRDGALGGRVALDVMHVRGVLTGGDTISYAGALTIGRYRGLRTVGHSGSDAGYRADFLRFPDQGYAFVTLCNVSNGDPGGSNRAVASILLDSAMTPLPQRPAGTPAAGSGGRGQGGGGAPNTPRVLAAAELAALQGSYHSSELDVTWTITPDGDVLRLSRPRFPDQSLRPLAADSLNAAVGTLRFTRDASGRIDGFELSSGRVRDLRFDRQREGGVAPR